MSQSSYTQKIIEIDIALDQNPQTTQVTKFTGTENNSVTLSNFRTSVRIQHSGSQSGSMAQVLVYGLTPTLMNDLSTLGLVFSLIQQNTLSVRAGDTVSGLSTVFIGTIRSAVPDFTHSPDNPFVFSCYGVNANEVTPAKATSYPQATDVATIISSLAQRMGYGFENNGVNVKLPSPYFSGSLMDQIRAAAAAANIVAEPVPGLVGQSQQIIAIWPKGGSRTSLKTVPFISPNTGMIGYPSYSQIGLTVKTLFNPQVALGGLVQIQSALPKATGTWVVLDLTHSLDSQIPDGLWESELVCFNPKYPVPTPAPPR